MAFRKWVAVTWADVAKGDSVILESEAWTVAKVKADGKKVRVTVERKGKTFSAKVPARGQVERVEIIKGKAWSEPDTPAESVVAEVLGATVEAVRPGKDECWIVPPVDQATIGSHLFLYHGIDPAGRESGAYETMLKVHAEDHERDLAELHVPHRHSKKRPIVDIGPRFQ